MNHAAVCRTAPAIPGLSVIFCCLWFIDSRRGLPTIEKFENRYDLPYMVIHRGRV